MNNPDQAISIMPVTVTSLPSKPAVDRAASTCSKVPKHQQLPEMKLETHR